MITFFLSSCGCYDTKQDAWDACNDKYNGKCRFLGDDFQVCENSDSGFSFFNPAKTRCLEIVRGEGIDESYCDSENGRNLIFNSNL